MHEERKRLVIHYKPITGLKTESFKNINNPDKIISNRNAPNIDRVLFGGEPFDISKHLKLYPEPKSKDE